MTVLVYGEEGDESPALGTGWFIAPGQVVTNRHVIIGGRWAEIRLSMGTVVPVVGVLADDEDHDLAILSVDMKDGPQPLPLAVREPREGDRVFVIGSPLGLEHTVSEGIISSVRDLPTLGKILQTTAAISPGSSGSPVFNMAGEVVGVATLQIVEGQSLNFAVTAQSVRALKPGTLQTVAKWSAGPKEGGKESPAYQLGFSAVLDKDYDRALSYFTQAAEGDSLNPEAWYSVGYCRGELGRLEDAIQAFKQAIRINPDYADAHYSLGVAYGELGRWEDAVNAQKQVIRINPDYADAHYNLGVAYGELGRSEDAVQACKQAIRINPDYAEAHYNLGVAYGELGRWEDEVQAYKQAIRINPDYADAHYSLGVAYGELGRWEDAAQANKQAIRIKPDYDSAYLNLGVAYGGLDRWEDAAQAFKQAIRINPDFAEAHCNLGLIYLMQNDKGAAIEEYKILKRLDRELADKLFNLIYP